MISYSLPPWTSFPSGGWTNCAGPTRAEIIAAADRMAALKPGQAEPRQILYVRQLPPRFEALPAGSVYDTLFGYRVVECKWMPETVKDRDGAEVELVGILAGELDRFMSLEQTAQRMVFLTGKVVRRFREP